MSTSLKEQSPLYLFARRARVAARQVHRVAHWGLRPTSWPSPQYPAPAERFDHPVGRIRVPVARRDPWAHPVFEAGKRHNLALAAAAFDGLLVTPEHPLSFWRVMGRLDQERGFVSGMELMGGCIVPSIGGGVCLLSNALFALAARHGWQILERHGHSVEAVPTSPDTLWGLDATVFWPHVDLRIAPQEGRARLTARIQNEHLLLGIDATAASPYTYRLHSQDERVEHDGEERIRHNRIERLQLDATSGRLLRTETIAINRKRLLHDQQFERNCLTCNETGCHARRTAVIAP